MTQAELQHLSVGDRVRFRGQSEAGVVHAIDDRAIEIHWPDATSTLIWFSHAADGRDMRHVFLNKVTAPLASAG
jgi:endonuclease V-like protein UPF0215 family